MDLSAEQDAGAGLAAPLTVSGSSEVALVPAEESACQTEVMTSAWTVRQAARHDASSQDRTRFVGQNRFTAD